MNAQQIFRLRITFAKQGRLALLSHLEVARTLERTIRRANLPFAVSCGFSPHMKVAFGAALPVGVGGSHEIADITLKTYVPAQKALAALQAASVADLMVLDATYIEPGAKAASVAFPKSTYRAMLSWAPATFPVPAQIKVIRKKKKKTLQVADFLPEEPQLEGTALTFMLEMKPTGSLRPDKLLNACMSLANESDETSVGAKENEGADEDEELLMLLENSWVESIDVQPLNSAPLRIRSITRIKQQ